MAKSSDWIHFNVEEPIKEWAWDTAQEKEDQCKRLKCRPVNYDQNNDMQFIGLVAEHYVAQYLAQDFDTSLTDEELTTRRYRPADVGEFIEVRNSKARPERCRLIWRAHRVDTTGEFLDKPYRLYIQCSMPDEDNLYLLGALWGFDAMKPAWFFPADKKWAYSTFRVPQASIKPMAPIKDWFHWTNNFKATGKVQGFSSTVRSGE